MSEQSEEEIYQQTLEQGLNILCEGLGVDPERFDTDQADTECYLDCFRQAAKVLKESGVKFDDWEGKWVFGKLLNRLDDDEQMAEDIASETKTGS